MTSAADVRLTMDGPASASASASEKSESRHRRFFATEDGDERHRRPGDWFVLTLSLLLFVALAVRAGHAGTFEADIARAMEDAPAWLHDAVGALYRFASLWTVGLLVLGAVVSARWRLVRDLATAAAASWVGARFIALLVAGPGVGDTLSRQDVASFPLVRVALMTSMMACASPYLTRPARRLGWAMVALVAALAATLPAGLPTDVLGGYLLGIAIGAGVHLVFGSPTGRPTLARVTSAVAELGMTVGTPATQRDERGASIVEWTEGDERAVAIALGRDAADFRVLARVWRVLWYRGGSAGLFDTRKDEVRDGALVALLAERAGVEAARLVTVGVADDDIAVIVLRHPSVPTLGELGADAASDGVLDRVWGQVANLHRARIAHGQLDTAHVVVSPAGTPTIIGIVDAEYDAPTAQQSRDVAEFIVSTGLLVGVERAVASAVRSLGQPAVADCLPYVQPPALSGATKDAVHQHDQRTKSKLLAEVRARAADATGTAEPELEQIQRVKARNVVFIVATFIGISALISQLGGIGNLWDEVKSAQWSWVAAAFAVSMLPPFAEAISMIGAVDVPVRLGPAVILQFAQKFTNLVMPGLLGTGAMTARFLTVQGVSLNNAIVSGGITSMAGTVVQFTLLVLALTVFDVHLDLGASASGGDPARLLVLLLIGAGVVIGTVWWIPSVHRRVVPQLSKAWRSIHTLVTDPRRITMVFGGNLGSQVLYAVVLGLCVQAYGHHLDLGTLIVVNTVSTLFASLIPVPGGMGIAEAALTAGLTAAGLPPSVAAAAALTHRLVTFYLPPVWGWIAMHWLTTKGYV